VRNPTAGKTSYHKRDSYKRALGLSLSLCLALALALGLRLALGLSLRPRLRPIPSQAVGGAGELAR